MKKEEYYPKTQELLNSMALRSNHGFGFYEKEVKEEILKRMNELYEAYIAGEGDKEISKNLKISIVSVAQIREEVNGKGFFQPKED